MNTVDQLRTSTRGPESQSWEFGFHARCAGIWSLWTGVWGAWSLVALAILTTTLVCTLVSASAGPDPISRAKTIAPYIDPLALGVMYVDVTRLDVDALVKELANLTGANVGEFADLREPIADWAADFTKAGGEELYIVLALPVDLRGFPAEFRSPLPARYVVVPLHPGANVDALTKLLCGKKSGRKVAQHKPQRSWQIPTAETCVQINDVLIAGPRSVVEDLRKGTIPERPGFADAFAAAGNAAIQWVIVPTADQRRVIEELWPTLPEEVGGGAITDITRGFLWGAMGLELSPQPSMRLVVQSQDAQAAQRFKVTSQKIYKAFSRDPLVRHLFPDREQLAKRIAPVVEGDRVIFEHQALNTLYRSILIRERENASRAMCQSVLRQLVLAAHNYHDTHKKLPAAASDDDQGRPLLSWRVHLLPFLANSELYEQFHLDEPWDSPHNRKLIERMPALFRCPKQRTEPGRTCYLAPIGKETLFPPTGEVINLFDIKDKPGQTILFVEVDDEHAVIWTKPDDWEFDPDDPRRSLGGHHLGGFNAGFADGRTLFILQTVDPHILRGAFTRSGGEDVSPLDLRE